MRHHALPVLVRSVAVLVAAWGTLTLVDRLSGPVVGANIGAGLAGLAAVVVVSLVWAGLDGVRAQQLRPVLVRWTAVTVVGTLGLTALSQLGAPGGFDVGLFLLELVFSSWFVLLLVAVPSFAAAAVSHALRGTRSRHHGPGAVGAAGI